MVLGGYVVGEDHDNPFGGIVGISLVASEMASLGLNNIPVGDLIFGPLTPRIQDIIKYLTHSADLLPEIVLVDTSTQVN